MSRTTQTTTVNPTARAARSATRRTWTWRATMAALAILPLVFVPVGIFTSPWLASRSELSYVSSAAILGIVAVATGMFVNLTGLPSVAQAGLWGIAAYAGGASMVHWGFNFWLSIVVAMVAAAAFALPGGALALRTRGMAFLIVTLALSEFFVLIMENATSITGGYNGLLYPGEAPSLGPITFDTPMKTYYLDVAFAFIVLAAYWFLRRSAFGRRLVAIRENENLARSLSINAYWHRLMVFEISAVLTAIAGPLVLLQQQIITPSLFTTDQFLDVYLMIMLGGVGTIAGPALGAWVVQALPQWIGLFGDISPNAQQLTLALLLVFFVLAARRGILGQIRYLVIGRSRKLGQKNSDASEANAMSHGSPQRARGDQAIEEVLNADVARPLRDEIILRVEGLSHSYGANKVLADVDFDVRLGEVRGLIGPNGSGKTTTLNCVSGFVSPTAGSIEFFGKDLAGDRFDKVAGAGLVRTFQQPEVFAALTVRETIELALSSIGSLGCGKATNEDLPDDAEYYLRMCLLEDVADQPSGDLPYGHARLLGVAAALATRPRLLMLDEPAAGLGSLDRVRLADVIRGAQAKGVAIVIVDHDMSFLLPICDRLTVLDYGLKIAEGDPQTVCRDRDVVAAYLGSGFAERHSLEHPEVKA